MCLFLFAWSFSAATEHLQNVPFKIHSMISVNMISVCKLNYYRHKFYLIFGPLGRLGGCQEITRKDSLTGTTERGARSSGVVGNVEAGVGRLSVHPPTYPPPFEHVSTVML